MRSSRRFSTAALVLSLCGITCALSSGADVAAASPLATPSAHRAAGGSGTIGGDQLASSLTVRPVGAPPLPTSVTAPSFVVADLDTGTVLAARDAHHRTLPASTLKVLTSLVLLPHLDPKQVVTARRSDVDIDGTRVGIVPGGRYTVNSLFQALILRSGNDAAELLARTGRTRSQTLAAMNSTADKLGAADTHAATPSGLDGPGQSTSAYDLALIDRAALKLPAFRRYIATRRSMFGAAGKPKFEIDTENRLLRDNFPGALGGKDGFTDAARHTFIGNATHNGHTYVATVTHADATAGRQAETLLTWAFARPLKSAGVGTLVEPGSAAAAATPGSAASTRAAGPPAEPDRTDTRVAAPADPAGSTARSAVTTLSLFALLLMATVVALRVRAVHRRTARERTHPSMRSGASHQPAPTRHAAPRKARRTLRPDGTPSRRPPAA